MNTTLFFTYGISLDDWKKTGLMSREIAIYEKMYIEHGIEFNFITYGSKEKTSSGNEKG